MGFLGAGAARQRDDPGAFFQPGSDFIIFGQLGERLEEHLHTIPLCIFVRSLYLSGDYVPRTGKRFFCKSRQSLCLFADYVLRAGKRFFCKNIQLLYLFGDYVPRTVLDPLVNFGNIISDDTQTYHDKTARKALQDNDRCEALESGAGIPFV